MGNPEYFTIRRHCRCCGSDALIPYLSFGSIPLVNALTDMPAPATERFPLEVNVCTQCWHTQLSGVVSPERLYGNYLYRSGVSQTFCHHADLLARRMAERFVHLPRVLDIGCNDGVLLRSFQSLGCAVLGVDPSPAVSDIPVVRGFWNEVVAAALDQRFDLITAQNVFAHCDDPGEFLRAAKSVLATDGRIVLEFPYYLRTLQRMEWDTLYHEHLSHFLVAPLQHLVQSQGLFIESLEEFAIHGGSVRLILSAQKPAQDPCLPFIAQEKAAGLYALSAYTAFAQRVAQQVERCRAIVADLPGRLIGYGACAKGTLFMHHTGITPDVIIDDTPSKWGKFIPGTAVAIVPRGQEGKGEKTVLMLAWNFYDEILPKARTVKDVRRVVRFIPDYLQELV